MTLKNESRLIGKISPKELNIYMNQFTFIVRAVKQTVNFLPTIFVLKRSFAFLRIFEFSILGALCSKSTLFRVALNHGDIVLAACLSFVWHFTATQSYIQRVYVSLKASLKYHGKDNDHAQEYAYGAFSTATRSSHGARDPNLRGTKYHCRVGPSLVTRQTRGVD